MRLPYMVANGAEREKRQDPDVRETGTERAYEDQKKQEEIRGIE